MHVHSLYLTFVDPCIIVKFIKKNPTRCNNLSNFIIPYLCEAQHVSCDTRPIIRSLKLHWQPLVYHTWKVVCTCSWWTLSGTVCAWQRPPTARPNNLSRMQKTRGCQCILRLLPTGGVSPETCWASFKYEIIKFDKLLHLVGFFLWTYIFLVLWLLYVVPNYG